MIQVIHHRRIFLGIAVFTVVCALGALAFYGVRQGVDFRGGTLWRFSVSPEGGIDSDALRGVIGDVTEDENVYVSMNEDGVVLARFVEVSEGAHQELLSALTEATHNFEELSFQSIGPAIGEALRTRSIVALGLVMLGISLYIAFAFRKVYRPVSSWKYGVVTLVTLMHDVIIPAGLLAFLGRYADVEIDGNFVVALLVIMGFSVHDTIVVFDRIRENLLTDRERSDFGEVITKSVNQTMARSVNTSLTLILVLLALLFFGPSTLFYFILTLLVGVSIGIYSSIFVASPLLFMWHGLSMKKSRI